MGEVPSRLPGSAGSEHLSQRICQPCLEKDNLIYAIGLCVDCQDYLCLKCFDEHKVQQHRVLDREQILHGQTQAKSEYSCSDSCPVHINEVIQYNCASHGYLGCKSCIKLDHATCDEVQFIPHVSKELVKNENYKQMGVQLKSVLDTFMNVFRNAQRNSENVDKSCTDALREIQDFRKQMEDVLGKIESKFLENVHTLNLKAENELAEMRNKYKSAHKELQSSLAKIESLQNANQNCSSYIEMMKTKEKMKSLEHLTKQATVDISYNRNPVRFSPNENLLALLRNPGGFGTMYSACTQTVLSGPDDVSMQSDTDTGSFLSLSDDISVISDTESLISKPLLRTGTILHGSDTGSVSTLSDDFSILSHETEPYFSDDFSVITDSGSRISHPSLHTEAIIPGSDTGDILSGSAFGKRAHHLQELSVKTKHDNCDITGEVVLPDNRLVLTDYKASSIKTVDLQTGQVVAQLQLTGRPWDIASIGKNKVAVTMPDQKKVGFFTVDANNLRFGRKLTVNGMCMGVAYRNGKLAVSFCDPDKIRIINLKGRVLRSIKGIQVPSRKFLYPRYLTFGRDENTLYVSNSWSHNLVCVTMSGIVMDTYHAEGLRIPRKSIVDSSGNVYVCASGSNTVHVIIKGKGIPQVLLTHADGLDRPLSICLSEKEDKLYVGMWDSNYVKVYSNLLKK